MPKDRRHRQRRTEAEWAEILRRFKSSGQGRREFCRREGLALSSFQRWRDRAGRASSPGTFVELVPATLAPAPARSSWELELSLPNGICFRLRG
jgi:transposase-like protein